jgi:hypothetical protein
MNAEFYRVTKFLILGILGQKVGGKFFIFVGILRGYMREKRKAALSIFPLPLKRRWFDFEKSNQLLLHL